MNLYMDDLRPIPDGWVGARSVDEAKEYLRRGVDRASFDHDMGACSNCVDRGEHVGDMATPETTYVNWCSHVPDGSDLVSWMEETGCWPNQKPYVHSMNPCGAARMRLAIERHYR